MKAASQPSRARSAFICLIALAFLAAALPKPSLSAGHSFEPREVVLTMDALAGGAAWMLGDEARSRLGKHSKQQSKAALLHAPSTAGSPERGSSLEPARLRGPLPSPRNLGAPTRAPPADR